MPSQNGKEKKKVLNKESSRTSGKKTIAFVEVVASIGMMLYAIRSSVDAESDSMTRLSWQQR